MEECRPITTMEEAEKPIGSAILPISGLRRDQTNKLTDDAINTVFESLRSRGMDLSSPEVKKKILKEGRLVGKTVKPVAKPAEPPKPAEPEQVVKKKKNNGEMILAALAAALLLV
jgi:hypothetical protein